MDYDGLLELVKKRRSIRRFKPDPIPDEHIEKIIEVARWAPSASNSQPWEFVVVKKKELRDRIVRLYEEYYGRAHRMEICREKDFIGRAFGVDAHRIPGFVDAPVLLILVGDPRTNYALSNSGRSNPVIALQCHTSNMANAFLYMHLAATMLGLGSQWVTGIAHPFEQCLVKNLLEIPDDLEIYDMMAVGYPVAEPKPRRIRALKEMIHYDYFDNSKFKTFEELKQILLARRKTQTYEDEFRK